MWGGGGGGIFLYRGMDIHTLYTCVPLSAYCFTDSESALFIKLVTTHVI